VVRAEDPARILDQALMDMQGELVRLRQAVAMAVASQKRIETRFQQARHQANHWYDRACTVLQQGNEGLAREALARCKPYEETAQTLGRQMESQATWKEKWRPWRQEQPQLPSRFLPSRETGKAWIWKPAFRS